MNESATKQEVVALVRVKAGELLELVHHLENILNEEGLEQPDDGGTPTGG